MKDCKLSVCKTSMFLRSIGIIVTIPLLMTTAIADTSIPTDRIFKLVDIDRPQERHQRQQLTSNIHKIDSKASESVKLGIQKFNNQDYQGALVDFNRAIQLDPKYVDAYNYRGNLKQRKLKDYQGALADFNRAIEIVPDYALIYRNRGALKLEHLNDYQGALADLNRAIQIAPNYAEAYGQRGGLKYEALNDRAGGIADTQQAARLFKKQGDITNYNVAIGLLKKWQQRDRKLRR